MATALEELQGGDVVVLRFGNGPHRLGLVEGAHRGTHSHGLPTVRAYVYSSTGGTWTRGPRPITRMQLVAHLGRAHRYHRFSDGRMQGWADPTPDRYMAADWLPTLRLHRLG